MSTNDGVMFVFYVQNLPVIPRPFASQQVTTIFPFVIVSNYLVRSRQSTEQLLVSQIVASMPESCRDKTGKITGDDVEKEFHEITLLRMDELLATC